MGEYAELEAIALSRDIPAAQTPTFCRVIQEKAGRCQEEKQGRDKTCHSFL
jgi:hypothetical protein